MNKNKKIIAFICAIAMVFSVFAAFTVTSSAASDKGIVLEYDKAASTTTKIVVNAKYVGVDELKAYSIRVNVPEGVTAENLAFKAADGIVEQSAEVLNNGVYGVTGASAKAFKNADKVLGTITITLSDSLTADFVMELADNSELTFTDNSAVGVGPSYSGDELMQTAWVKISNAKPLDNKMPLITEGDDKGLVDAPSGTLSDNAYAALEVKKSDGTPATYGEDYVAYYKGEKLTKEQLDNLLAGLYCAEAGVSLVDMLKDVELEYNRGITGTLQIVDNDEVVVDGNTPSSGKPTTAPTSAPAKKATITQANVSVKVNQVAVVAPVLKINNKVVKNATFDFDYSEKPAELGENATDEDKTKYDKDLKAYEDDKEKDKTYFDFVGDRENVESAKLTGIKTISNREIYIKVHSVPEGTVLPDGVDSVADIAGIKVKVSVSRASSSNSGNSGSSGSDDDDDDSSSGPIAGPSQQGTTPNGPTAGNYYIDTDATPWAEYAINGLTAKGLLTGYGDRIFKPNNNVTRAEFATMLINIFNIPTNTSSVSFGDVSTGDWFYTAVQSCAAVGVVSGYGNGYFDPNRTIDRQEMASMVYRAARNCGKSDYIKPIVAERVFADEYQIADYAKEAVKVLQMAGIISGMSETEYCPIEKATRAQAAVMLYPFSN